MDGISAATWLVLPVTSHLCGATPFGWVAGWLNGIDIREHGSKNPGATNVWRVLGWRWGLLVFVLDALKGAAPTLAAGLFLQSAQPESVGTAEYHGVRVACLVAATLGHTFTFWLGFRGGKGVATTLGGLLAVWPELTVPGLAAFALWGAVMAVRRTVSLASIIAAAAFPVMFVGWHGGESVGALWPLLACSVLLATLIIGLHRANIRRLWEGTEPRLGQSKPAGAPVADPAASDRSADGSPDRSPTPAA